MPIRSRYLLALADQDAVGSRMRTGASAANDGSFLAKQQHPSCAFLFLNSGSIRLKWPQVPIAPALNFVLVLVHTS